MAGENDTTTLTGSLKIVYGKTYKKLIPSFNIFSRKIGFEKANAIGKAFHQGVAVKDEQGFSYTKADTLPASMLDPIPGKIENAQIDGSQGLLRGRMTYEVAAKASGGPRAFVQSAGYLIESMLKTSSCRLEMNLLHGQKGLGVLDTGSTTTSLIITAASWSPGLWFAKEGAKVELTDAAGTTSRGHGTISAINLATRTITVSAITGAVATDIVWFATEKSTNPAPTTNVENGMQGLDSILSAPTTLHGITTASYTAWQSVTDSAAAPISLDSVNAMKANLLSRGGEGDYWLTLSPKRWGKLATDFAGLRRLAKDDGTTYSLGAKALQIFSQGGLITIMAHPFLKDGQAFMINPDDFDRIGAQDLSFKTPGRDENLFDIVSGPMAYEIQNYYNQALLCTAPARQGRWTALTD